MQEKQEKLKSKGKYSVSQFTKCKMCEKLMCFHRRCKNCKILLHAKNDKYKNQAGRQFTEDGGNGYCVDCTV